MREVASNLSRPQHQDVISDPFPSSIDIFETNPDIISFEGGRIVIVRDLLWLWGMNYWLSQIFRNKGHLYLGTGYEIEILVSQLRLPPQPPLYPPKKSRQTIHVLENNVILCFESHPTCMNWIHLVPLKNHSARNGHQNPSLFCWTVCILIKGTPLQLCESSTHWGGPASKIQPKFFSDCSSKGRQIVQSFRVDNCQTFLCGPLLVRVKFSFESKREISFNIFSQKWSDSFSLRGRHWQHVFYFGRPPVLKTCTAALQRHSNSTSAPIRQGYHS